MVNATTVDRPPRKSRWPVLIPIVLALLIPGAIAGGRALEKQPTFCASCHESQEYYDLWLRSGAAKDHPNCIECHTGPGLAGVLDGQVRGLKHLAVHFFGTIRKPFQPVRMVVFCLKCHPTERVAREHREVQMTGKACAECHNHRPGANFNGEDGEEDSE